MQHLNLYTQLEKPKQLPFAASQQLWILAVALLVMLSVYGWLLISQSSINSELSELEQQQRTIDEKLAELNAEKERLLKDNSLAKEIELLKKDVSFRRELLASVEPDSHSMGGGFSDHLEGLARQHIDGMWFTEIELYQGGQQLALLGQTRAPEFVPRYLQRLSDESIFEGHQFRIFKIYTPDEQSGLLNFELRSKEQGMESLEGSSYVGTLGENR